MYSDQKIPAPFGQPCHNRRTAKQTQDIPAPPALSAEEEIPISAEEKAVPKAAADSSSLPTPFLAFLLFDLFSHKKEF